jgi:hypothetical protein
MRFVVVIDFERDVSFFFPEAFCGSGFSKEGTKLEEDNREKLLLHQDEEDKSQHVVEDEDSEQQSLVGVSLSPCCSKLCWRRTRLEIKCASFFLS